MVQQPVPAPDPALAERVKRMDQWLAELNRQGAASHTSAGLLGLLFGGIEIGAGAFVVFEKDASNGMARGAVGSLFFGFGAASLAGAVHSFAYARTSDELRYERWRSLTSVDAVTLAHFEGELAAEAAIGRQRRLANGAGFIGLAAGGALVLGITPISRMHGDAANVAYVIGAFDVVVGVWFAITNLTGESPNEAVYRQYQEGKSPEHAAMKFAITPALARDGAGLKLALTL